ncbi:CLUMA_CG015277, isoform A [Clunio marinus]|uniref:Zinc finger CCCH domain-containing protein 14 n=1 Tax=Clunio marinus TaxID=568069 RepID=A0A1J1IPJ7_9DIPT|nr:CLUMA_CG015277, isoform A [Clunio marinus]
MDSLGEVGKKMRSAIKAKLLELGTGSQSGYIDDELPDYVMIMVANKRSKSQMLTDLNLFLGSNTEIFVNWLHQVLQKLQEVTLPNNLASKTKKKESEVITKKEKKKDKKKNSKETSITDVIAVELIEKAKKTLEVEKEVKKEATKSPSPQPATVIKAKMPDPPAPPHINPPAMSDHEKDKDDDEFDIPTISEIKTSAGNHNLHKKELSQLQELQNRIYKTKRKLQEFGSDSEDVPASKKPVKSRLGVKPIENTKSSNIISLSAIRRTEKEIYVAPSFKKLIERQKEENDRRGSEIMRRSDSNKLPLNTKHSRRSRSVSRSRERYRPRRDRSRSPVKRSRSPYKASRSPKHRSNIHQRIGSRIVANSPEKDAPVRIKFRPALNSAVTAQAGKNLLLRAVAEAQRSTALASQMQQRRKPQRDNIVIHVPLRKDKRNIRLDEEYIPEAVSSQTESDAEYHPSIHNKPPVIDDGDDGDVVYLNNVEDVEDLEDLDEEMPKSPQFVVTLEGVTQFDKKSKSSSHSPTPPPVIKRKSIKDRIGMKPVIPPGNWEERQTVKRKSEEESESQRAYNQAKKTRLSPIKFDLTDDENEERKSRETSVERRSVTSESNKDDEKKNEEQNGEEIAKRIKLEPSRSFDHVPPLLSSVAVPVPEVAKPIVKTKERCKFYPLCTNASCAFYHPTHPCKLFPNCKFGDSCAYIHPRCKFDTSCTREDCNFSHSQANVGQIIPPIASSVVPVQNYKSISITPNTTICKFFPGCTNTNCIFLHPKVCKFGKACLNKFDCNFYHFETSSKSKFKWVSPLS